jgi:hypothetical protein
VFETLVLHRWQSVIAASVEHSFESQEA